MSAMKNTNGMAMEAFSKAGDLHKRIIFTLVALFLYRFGTFVPLPGINPDVLSDIFANSKNGLLNMFDTFAGGALSRMALLTLNIMPYISASIIIQLGSSIFPSLFCSLGYPGNGVLETLPRNFIYTSTSSSFTGSFFKSFRIRLFLSISRDLTSLFEKLYKPTRAS